MLKPRLYQCYCNQTNQLSNKKKIINLDINDKNYSLLKQKYAFENKCLIKSLKAIIMHYIYLTSIF